MIDIIPLIYPALSTNESLVSLLGDRTRIRSLTKGDGYPCITYFLLNQVERDYTDDQATTDELAVQLSIWVDNQSESMPIAKEVDKSMKGLGFKRTFMMDAYEEDINIYQKISRYRGKIIKEE